ncbi:MAG: DNA adenine methylase [Anaerotignaceae bacterium]
MIKSIISWVGGKSKLMWLINLLVPPKYERSIDVFGGSGTVTLNLECWQSNLRIYNDFNANLVNLMRCARDRPLSLMREIGFLALNARDDFEIYKRFMEKEEFYEDDLKTEMELSEIMFNPPTAKEVEKLLIKNANEKDIKRAAAYYKLLRYSFSANGETFGGKRCNVHRFFLDIWNFSKAFSDVVVENKDFEALIKQYDREKAFIYCDPPYYDAEGFYAVAFPKEDHIRLHHTLVKAQGYVMVSYNNAPEIVQLYKEFYIFYTTRANSMSRKEGEVYEELIITNYDPRVFLEKKNNQLSLFSAGNFSNDGDYKLIYQPPQPLKK